MDSPKSQIQTRRVAKIILKYRKLTGWGAQAPVVYTLQKIGLKFVL